MKTLFKNKFILLVIAIVTIGAFMLNNSKSASIQANDPFDSEIIARGDLTHSIAATGRVRALVTVEVGSQLSGKIEQLFVDFNDSVKKGEIVAQIDPQSFQQSVLQARADLMSTQANVKVQQANVTRSQITLKQAERDFQRQQPLAVEGLISSTLLEATQSLRDTALASLAIAKAQVESAKANAKQRAAALANAEIDLSRTQIRSPIDGVVIQRNVDRGQTVAASLSAPILFKIAQDLTEILIEANVDESDIGRVRSGNSVTFAVDAYEGQTFHGRVAQVRLSPIEINNVVTYSVIVNASNSRLLLLPGMTANLEIKTGQRLDVLRLPNQALRLRLSDEMNLIASHAQNKPGKSGKRRSGGNRGNGKMAGLLEQLGVDSATQQQIQAQTRAAMKEMRSQVQQGGERKAIRELRRKLTQKILRQNITADQMKQLQSLQQRPAEIRLAQVWIKDKDGQLKPINVRLGISNDQYTEIVGGELKVGTEIIVRIKPARS